MKLFRSGLSPHHTALAMIGARPGHTVVVFGAGDPALAAELALVTGLNGRTVVADSRDQTRASVAAAAEHAGALLDFELLTGGELPIERGTVDLVVLQQHFGAVGGGGEHGILGEALRLVRSGGRVVAIEGERRRARLFGSPPPPGISGDAIVSRFSGAGMIAARVLAESEGVVYVEGRKP